MVGADHRSPRHADTRELDDLLHESGLFGRRLTSKQGHGEPNPTWIPIGHDAVRRIARRIGGFPAGGWNDVFNIPMTAHLLGGAVIGDSAETGRDRSVPPGLRPPRSPRRGRCVGSANLGVNPSLTITAQAERAMALWPNRGEPDPRAPLGRAVRRIDPIAPRHRLVPADAPGALPAYGGTTARALIDAREKASRPCKPGPARSSS